MKKVDISIELDNASRQIVVQSLMPELTHPGPRTNVKLSETDSGILLSFAADDTSSLRAALNSHLRWLNCIITTANTFKQNK